MAAKSQKALKSPATDNASDGKPFSYDNVPYESYTYAQTHPVHMALIGSLFGMTPPDVKTARVLELGCASGGNLFSQAINYPGARFLGLDLSQGQIDLANRQKLDLGLTNIDFLQQDILKFDLKKNKGAFDYIVCHGVYSWVPEDVSEKILELCHECLSENGIAVISYNTLPGWNAVRSLREMMLFHANRFEKPADKIRESRLLLAFLAETAQKGSSYYNAIEEERRLLETVNDTYLYHDHLEGVNRQFYFHQFMQSIHKHGLAYVGDSSLASMFIENLPAKAMDTLKAVNDIVLQEQYMDFVTNRRFRTSIICRKGNRITRALKGPQIMNYYISTSMKPDIENPASGQEVKFTRTGNAAQFNTSNEIAATLFTEISKSGIRPIHARDAVAATAKKLKLKDTKLIEAILMEHGLHLALRGFINLHIDCPAFVDTVSKKPVGYPLARLQAQAANCVRFTNVLHAMVPADRLGALIMRELDGSRTCDDIVNSLIAQAISGSITLNDRDGRPIKDETRIRDKMDESVPEILGKMAQHALLVA